MTTPGEMVRDYQTSAGFSVESPPADERTVRAVEPDSAALAADWNQVMSLLA